MKENGEKEKQEKGREGKFNSVGRNLKNLSKRKKNWGKKQGQH